MTRFGVWFGQWVRFIFERQKFKMASNVEELLQYFEQKCAKISRILELRGIGAV